MLRRLTLMVAFSALGAAGLGACGSETTDARVCAPALEEVCQCDDGRSGIRTCTSNGDGYGPCDCTAGTGGSGGGGGGSGGDIGSGGSGGSIPVGDAGKDAETPDAGKETPDAASPDSSAGDAGDSSSPDASGADSAPPDAGGEDDECTSCLVLHCAAELGVCDAAPGCLEDAGTGFSDVECLFVCLDDIVDEGDGPVELSDVADCATFCDAGGPATDLFACMFGEGGGADCKAECNY